MKSDLRRVGLLALQLGALCAAGSAAADEPIKRVNVVVEELPEVAAKCNVSVDAIQASARRALRSNSIEILQYFDPESIVFYVNASVLYHPAGICFSDLTVRFYTANTARIPGSKFSAFADVVFCEQSSDQVGEPDDFGQRLSARIEDATNRCVGRISSKAKPIKP